MHHWADDSIFYHIYPLGFCGAPKENDFTSKAVPRLDKIYGWLDHIQSLGVNAIYLGPVFESDAHGYDTADYYQVDRRLGDNRTLAALSGELHTRGMRLILDGVFNHVGRHFWAFRDVQENLAKSPYCSWLHRIDFSKKSPYGDPFDYEPWSGYYNLVKLNLHNQDVVDHLLGAVAQWVEDFQIDGLRLDVADNLLPDFIRQLYTFSKNLRSDFWLMGEIYHGDYNLWTKPGMLDSATNYDLYKALVSTHNDENYFEIAHTLNRQFGQYGIYKHLALYNFVDNHDVSRIASALKNEKHFPLVYLLMYTNPGVPSIYYGSEWGIQGKKLPHSDDPMRPSLDLLEIKAGPKALGLEDLITRLSVMRNSIPALRYGNYQQLDVSSSQLAYMRQWQRQSVVAALNSSQEPVRRQVPVPLPEGTCMVDWLQPEVGAVVTGGKLDLEIGPNEGRVFYTRGE